MIEASTDTSGLAARLAAQARAHAEAHAESRLREARTDASRWRRADLIWPSFSRGT